jgi:hypothetical protein
LILFVSGYVIFLVIGWIPQNGRIDFATIMLVVVTGLGAAVLVSPKTQQSFFEMFGRVRSFQVASMRVELAEIRAQQIDQSARLEILGLLLPLRLIPLSQVNQNLGLAGQIRNGAGFEFFRRS